MLVAIHQPHYLPWLPYLAKIAHCDLFIVLDDVDFTRNGWQNRNRIKSRQGPLLLTVPVRHKLGQKLNEVKIASADWERKHWTSLQQSYGRSPCFDRGLEALYTRRWEGLAELCWEMLAWTLPRLGVTTPLRRSSELGVGTTSSQRLADLVRAVGGTAYLSGRYALQEYLDPAVLAAAGVDLRLFDWTCPEYPQPYGSFVPNLAGLDLWSQCGTQGRDVLLAGGKVSRPG